MVLLFGLSVTRLTSITVGQIEQNDTKTHLMLARHRLIVPPLLACLLIQQRDHAATRWTVGTTAKPGRPNSGAYTAEPPTAMHHKHPLNAAASGLVLAVTPPLAGLASDLP